MLGNGVEASCLLRLRRWGPVTSEEASSSWEGQPFKSVDKTTCQFRDMGSSGRRDKWMCSLNWELASVGRSIELLVSKSTNRLLGHFLPVYSPADAEVRRLLRIARIGRSLHRGMVTEDRHPDSVRKESLGTPKSNGLATVASHELYSASEVGGRRLPSQPRSAFRNTQVELEVRKRDRKGTGGRPR